jgi:ribosomal protein S10
MIKYNSSLKITDYSESQLNNFCETLKILGEKDKIYLNFKLKNPIKKSKQNTILRSPHVNKKARDQIKIEYFSKYIHFKNNYKSYNFLNKVMQNSSINIHMRTIFKEQVFFVLL